MTADRITRSLSFLSVVLAMSTATIGCTTTSDAGSATEVRSGRAADVDDSTDAARRLYQRKCSTCHAAPVVAHFDDASWRSIMPGMAREARLSRSETRILTDFVLAENESD